MKNKSKPCYFQCYLDNEHMLSHLNNEQAGVLWKALFSYANHAEELSSADPMISMAYTTMKAQIDRDFSKYQQKCEKNRINGAKRGKTEVNSSERYQTLATASVCSQEEEKEEKKEEEKEEYKEKEEEKENASSLSLRIDAVDKYKIELIINSLNKLTEAQYSPNDSATQRLIAKRLSDGYKLADFFSVIEHKSCEWANDSEKRSLLCPKELFSDKFEIYLDEAKNSSTAKQSETRTQSDQNKNSPP